MVQIISSYADDFYKNERESSMTKNIQGVGFGGHYDETDGVGFGRHYDETDFKCQLLLRWTSYGHKLSIPIQ